MKTEEKEITEKIKSYKDACIELRISVQKIKINKSVDDIARSTSAFYQLCIIIRALNEGWKPDWADWSERKWFNWFYFASNGAYAGFASSGTSLSPAFTFTDVGARFCFKSKALAEYAANQFKSLYEDYLLIQK